MSEPTRPPHVQRCTYQELIRGTWWQCLENDPHPAGESRGHRFSSAAEFGRPLHELPAEQLAAHLRDRIALTRNLQRRVDELTAIAMDLAASRASGNTPQPETVAWVCAHHPTAARLMVWDQ